jgi:hypothetical protein
MKINWLAVLLAVVFGMGLGFLFYGHLFQNLWMSGNGITMDAEHTKMFKNGVEMPMSLTPMIFNTLVMIVYALGLIWLLSKTQAQNWMDGLMVGGLIGLFTLLGVFVGNMFAMNPSSLSMIDGLYSLLLFAGMGAILAYFRKQ